MNVAEDKSVTRAADTARVVRTLWSLLESKRRLQFALLVSLLFVAGIVEMSGMVALFGFTSGLNAVNGHRKGPLAKVLTYAFGALPQLEYVLAAGAIVIGLLLLKNVLSSSVHFALNRFFMKLNERVSQKMFEGYLLARFEIFGARGISEPISRVGRAFDLLGACFTAASQVLADSAIVITVALLLVIVDPWITFGAVLLFGTAGVGLHLGTQRFLAQLGKNESSAQKAAKKSLREGFYGLIDGRLNGTRGYFVANYKKAIGSSSLSRRRRALISRMPQSINEVLLATAIVGTVLYITLRGLSITDALPTLTIFAFAGLRLTAALSRIARGLQVIRQKSFDFSRFEADISEVAPEVFIHRQHEVPSSRYLDGKQAGPPLSFAHTLEFRNVTFTYPGAAKPALADVSFTVERGRFVSFCGGSGGGKTTLLLTLMGMLTPDSGAILVDGVDISTSLRSWHEKLSYVGQTPYLTASTIRDNVTFGRTQNDTNDELVWDALRRAQAADFVRDLPKGLDTELSDGGLRISGGQRQRLVIARSLYKNSEVLVLDEATAALDNVTEQEITRAIVGLSGEKTVVCVAHRLTTIERSDRIHVLHDGRIVASGTYESLLSESVHFQSLALAGNDRVEAT